MYIHIIEYNLFFININIYIVLNCMAYSFHSIPPYKFLYEPISMMYPNTIVYLHLLLNTYTFL